MSVELPEAFNDRPSALRWSARKHDNQRRLFYVLATMDDGMSLYPLCRAAQVRAGFVAPRLTDYLERGWLRDEWKPQEKGPPRRFYYPTPRGRKVFIDMATH